VNKIVSERQKAPSEVKKSPLKTIKLWRVHRDALMRIEEKRAGS